MIDAKLAELKLDRTIIQIQGQDTKRFLQGLITNDISLTQLGVIYSCLLNSKGRYQFDFFIIYVDDTTYLIDIESKQVDTFCNSLDFYKLLDDVHWKKQEYMVFNVFNQNDDVLKITDAFIIYKDPRLEQLGSRLILKSKINVADFSYVHPQEYKRFRYKNAILEGSELILNKSIPLECGFDELGAISYNKGCYLGQELTNASKHKMVIRKRLLPYIIPKNANISAQDKVQILHNNQVVGTIYDVYDDIAVGLTKLEFIKEDLKINDIGVKLQFPKWIVMT